MKFYTVASRLFSIRPNPWRLLYKIYSTPKVNFILGSNQHKIRSTPKEDELKCTPLLAGIKIEIRKFS